MSHFKDNEELDSFFEHIQADSLRLRDVTKSILLYLVIILAGIGFYWLLGLLK